MSREFFFCDRTIYELIKLAYYMKSHPCDICHPFDEIIHHDKTSLASFGLKIHGDTEGYRHRNFSYFGS